MTRRAPTAGALRAALLALLTGTCGADETTDPHVPAVSLLVVSGDGQQATVGTELPEPLVVRVLDTRGRPVKGQLLNFRVAQGDGSLYAGSSLTNANGNAQDYWTMGPTPGPAALEVRAVDAATGAKQSFAMFTATALPRMFALTTSIGSGSGRIVSSPAGIDCGADCSETYAEGTVVDLTAYADPGFLFQIWVGACSGGGSCTLTMSGDNAVTAHFRQLYLVSITVTGPGAVSGGGLNCIPDLGELKCSAYFEPGTLLILNASPISIDAVFDGWTGEPCDAFPTTPECAFFVGSGAGGDVQLGASFSVPGTGAARNGSGRAFAPGGRTRTRGTAAEDTGHDPWTHGVYSGKGRINVARALGMIE